MTSTPSATPSTPPAPVHYGDAEPPSLLAILGRDGLLQILVLGALLVVVFWNPLSLSVVYRWRNDADWSHGWLVPFFSLYFLNVHRDQLAAAKRKTSYFGLAVVILSLTLYFWTLAIRPVTYARPLCFVSTVFGLTLFLGGWQIIRVAWFPIAFLVLAVPIPTNLYVDVTMPLRKIASLGSSEILGMIPGLQTEVAGVVIDYVYNGSPGSLNVEQACSGMRLTMAFVTLGVAMAYLGDRPFWQRAIMVLSCLPIAIFCNLIRVTITGLLYVFRNEPIGEKWNFDSLAHGTPHALLGIAMLPIALGLFALTGWVLGNLMVEDADEPVQGSQEAS